MPTGQPTARAHTVHAGPHTVVLVGRDLEEALDEAAHAEAEGERDVAMPYWTELWPSARALAAWLVSPDGAARVRDRLVIELGAGLGLGAIVAALAGARWVLATDHAPAALGYALANARGAGVDAQVACAALDWRAPDTMTAFAGSAAPADVPSAPSAPDAPSAVFSTPRFEVAIGADLCYEAGNVALVLDALDRVLASPGACYLADPRREAGRRLAWAAAERGFSAERLATLGVTQGGDVVPADDPAGHPVDIWRLARG